MSKKHLGTWNSELGTFQKINALANKVDSRLLIFLILASNSLYPYLNGNEEQYLLNAKMYMQPDFMPDYFNAVDFPLPRMLHLFIAGSMLKILSFEWTAIIGKLILAFLFAFPFSRFFKHFEIENLSIIWILQLLYLPNQSLFAAEWIFLSFEGKQIAYLFIFWAITFLLKKQYWKVAIFGAIAAYFHILAAFWFLVLFCVYHLFKEKNLKQSISMASLSLILVAPFIYLIATALGTDAPIIQNGVHADWIYTAYRNPHHTYIFRDSDYFWIVFAKGVIASAVLYLFCLFYFSKNKNEQVLQLNGLNITVFSLLMIVILIGAIDSNGQFLKYYPYRLSAYTSLFMITQLYLVIRNSSLWQDRIIKFNWVIAIVAIGVLGFKVADHFRVFEKTKKTEKRAAFIELTNYIKQETDANASFIFYEEGVSERNHIYNDFSRRALRKRFVSYKFVPTKPDKLHLWYQRCMDRKAFFQDYQHIDKILKNYDLDYIIIDGEPVNDGRKTIFENTYFSLKKAI